MSKNLRWRGITVAVLIIIALLYLTPSLTKELPGWWAGSGMLPEEKIHLGLDLQGGMHLVLEVDVDEAVVKEIDRTYDDLKEDLRSERIRFNLKREGARGISAKILRESDRESFEDLVRSHFSSFDIKGPEAVGNGFLYRLSLKKAAEEDAKTKAFDQARRTIESRVDEFGVSEPDIRPMADYRIQIQLPGVKEPERAKKIIQRAALLEFKMVDEEHSLDDALKGNVPPGSEVMYDVEGSPETGAEAYLIKKKTELTGQYITDARVAWNEFNEPYVIVTFDRQGAKMFERLTGDNIGKYLAIIIDDKVQTAAVIRDKIGARCSISGSSYTDESARDLALVLRSGSLPASVKPIEERTVGPSLGQDSIDKGRKSMVVGCIIVIIFMLIYYGVSGLIADIALMLNVLFIMAGLAFFEATLTLPGIAGMILTIGMAVDANVLIFERIREELKLGKTTRTAIESGFSKAIVTILDANVTTFFAALVLYQFGTGPIKGFAVTLMIGIVASFITAVFVARVIFDFLYTKLNWKKISI